jgi:HNH endonuclease
MPSIGRHNSPSFWCWQDALIKAGLESLYSGGQVSSKMKTQSGKRVSNDDLIAEMKRVHALVGRGVLTVRDLDANSIASSQTVTGRYGCWADALKHAGIHQSEMANKAWTPEQCFENLAEVWTHYGKSPSFRQICSFRHIKSQGTRM